MRIRIMLFSVLMLFVISGITVAQGDAKTESAAAGWSESQKFSYILGTQIGAFSKKSDLEVNIEMFANGLNDMTESGELAMSEAEINAFMVSLQKKEQAKTQIAMKAASAGNIKKGQTFLDANKEKDGIKVTASGLQYKVIIEGNGAKPAATDKVKVHYSYFD